MLSLSFSKYSEYNGSWYTVHRDHFDLFMLEEPYHRCSTVQYSAVQYSTVQYSTAQYTVQSFHSLLLLVNTDTREYIFRVLGTTRERGFYTDMEDLKVETSLIYPTYDMMF